MANKFNNSLFIVFILISSYFVLSLNKSDNISNLITKGNAAYEVERTSQAICLSF